MSIAYGVTWTDTRPIQRALTVTLALGLMISVLLAAQAWGTDARLPMIVRAEPGQAAAVERSVRLSGASIERRLPIIDGFRALVPASRLTAIAELPGVFSVTPDGAVKMNTLIDRLGYDTAEDGSLFDIARAIGASTAWKSGFTGRGVDIAMIDTGVAPSDELAGRVINGPDLSFDTPDPALRYLDGYGHGTHMAGIIAGRDTALAPGAVPTEQHFAGIAPDARIVNVKVGAYDGATDVSQVLAAIDWVIQHRRDGDLNIRVLNLSFGTDGTQDYRLDPLTYAVEQAWRAGIVVVAAAGNEGYGSTHLNNPAYDPFIIAVGADDMRQSLGSTNDRVPDFSSRGYDRNPDFVAPGKSVISLRAAGSWIDEAVPTARVGDRFFRGSGTSQSAAVTSGAVALLLQQRPDLTPDQVKYLLRATAAKMSQEVSAGKGQGLLNIGAAIAAATPSAATAAQSFEPATGVGKLDLARGTLRISLKNNPKFGEVDVFGLPFVSELWATRCAARTAWQGGVWMGRSWSGDGWTNETWTGRSWSGRSWSAGEWVGHSWSGHSWSGRSWSGRSWSGGGWVGHSWSSNTWTGNLWSGAGWGP